MTRAESSLRRGMAGDAAVKPIAWLCWRSGAALACARGLGGTLPLPGRPGAGGCAAGLPRHPACLTGADVALRSSFWVCFFSLVLHWVI